MRRFSFATQGRGIWHGHGRGDEPGEARRRDELEREYRVLPHEYMVSTKEWAEADVEAAAAALREIRNKPELVAERTAKGKLFMEEHFSIANFKKSVDAFLDDKL